MCPSTTVYLSLCANECVQSMRNNAHQVQARFGIANVMQVLPFLRFGDGFVMKVGKNGDKRKNEALAPGRWAAFTPAGLPRCCMETRTWASGQHACTNCFFRIYLKADEYALHRAKIPTANGACMLINQPMVFGMRAAPLCAPIVMVRMVPVVMVVVAASDHVPELVMHLQANHQCPNREQGAGKQGTLGCVELGNHGSAKVGHSSTGNFQKFRKLPTSSACIRAVILALYETQLGSIHFTSCCKHTDGGSSHRPSVPDRHGFIR